MGQNIPDSIKMIVFEESGLQCSYCGYRNGLKLTCHHLDPKSKGGRACYENLIALCRLCHDKAEKGSITAKELRRMKRLMVHRYFTLPAVNALTIAATTGQGYVVIFNFLVKHLEDGGYLQQISGTMSPACDLYDGMPHAASYKITRKGHSLYKRWIMRSDGENIS
jgi:hypothetical protein